MIFRLVYWRAKRQGMTCGGRKPGVRKQKGCPAKPVNLLHNGLSNRSSDGCVISTHRKMKMFTRFRESNQSWYAQRLKNYDQDIGRKGSNGCNHEKQFNQEARPRIYVWSDGQRQDDSQQP